MDTIVELMKTLNLKSPNQAMMILTLLDNKQYRYYISEAELKYLLDKELIISVDGIFSLRGKAIELLQPKSDVSRFDELLNLFPRKTPRGRILRPASSSSKQGIIIKKKFIKALKIDSFDNIINGLENEISYRTSNNSLEYMHNFETWINRAEWQDYQENNEETDEYIDYGT